MAKAVLLDISGVLYEDAEVLPGAVEAVHTLQDEGIPLRFITNTSRRTQEAIFEDLRRMGFTIYREQIYTAPVAIRDYLRNRELRPFLLVHEQLEPEFEMLDQSSPNAVVICDAGDRFDYAHLNRAFQLLEKGMPLIAVGINRYFRSAGELQLDAGPFVKALEYATDTRALILGKPSEDFFETVLAGVGVAASDALMVGDDVESDVIGAMDAGLNGCLVKTGKYREGDELRAPGAFIADDLLDAVQRWSF